MSLMNLVTKFTAKDNFSDVVNTMSKSVKSFGKSTNASLERVNTKLNSFRNHAIGGGVALGVAVKQSNDFEKSMSNVSTLLDTSVEDMGKMGDKVLELSKRIPKPIEELTQSLYDIRSAGISAKDAMAALETAGNLSVAGLSTVGEATNILTSAMNAFKSEGLKSSEIANILFKTVKAGKTDISKLSMSFGANAATVVSAGIKLRDFQAATAALTTTGVEASQAQNQIRGAVSKLMVPTSDMTKIFKGLKVASGEALIKQKGGLLGAMEAIGSQAKKMGINVKKAWSESEAISAYLSLTGANRDTYVATLKDMQKSTDLLTEGVGKQSKTNSAQLQLAKNNMQALSITIGTQLAPVITELTKFIGPLIKSFGEMLQRNKWIMKVLVGLVGVFVLFKVALIASRVIMIANSFIMGLMAVRAGAMSIAMNGNAIAIGVFTVATNIATAAQWLFNAAMTANPIGLVIAGIAALVAIVAIAVENYDTWGAALLLVMGPLGAIVNIVMGFKKHWGEIQETFKNEGMMAGIIKIKNVLIDSLLYPIEQFLGLLSKIPGVSKLISPALNFVGDMRQKLDLNNGKEPSPSTAQASTAQASSESVTKAIIEKNNNIRPGISSPKNDVGLLSKTPGVSKFISPALNFGGDMRQKLDLTIEKEPLPSTAQASSESVTKAITEKNNNIRLGISSPKNDVEILENTGEIPIFMGETAGAF